MKAITVDELGTPPVLRDDLPEPTPDANEVLVRVRASSVNPVDNAIAGGILTGVVDHEFPVTLGRDYAGVVEQVGNAVTGYAVGDEVYGFVLHANPAVHAGSWTELITVPEDTGIRRAPASVDLSTTGAAPLAGITAMTAIDALGLSDGDTVLIVGATGGVGSFAVQPAAATGATVLVPALPEDEQYLRGLGMTELLARDGDVAAAVRERFPDGVDALLDLVSYGPGAYDAALKGGGRIASPNGAAGDGSDRTNVMAQPTTKNLERLAAHLDNGALKVPVQDTYELDRAIETLNVLASTHTQGKLALRVA